MKNIRGRTQPSRFAFLIFWNHVPDLVDCRSRVAGILVLANLFLHYAFDSFMERQYPQILWARYADDGVIHCTTEQQAYALKEVLSQRFKECRLELHPEKTKIIYCGKNKELRKGKPHSFDFLGYTFRPRKAVDRQGKLFTSFLPAMSGKAKKKIRQEVTGWRLQGKTTMEIEALAKIYNPKIRGWLNYYGKFYPSEARKMLGHINDCLMKWVRKKYKKCNSYKKARRWLSRIIGKKPALFVHWEVGAT